MYEPIAIVDVFFFQFLFNYSELYVCLYNYNTWYTLEKIAKTSLSSELGGPTGNRFKIYTTNDNG